jgi:hypothetical protein
MQMIPVDGFREIHRDGAAPVAAAYPVRQTHGGFRGAKTSPMHSGRNHCTLPRSRGNFHLSKT